MGIKVRKHPEELTATASTDNVPSVFLRPGYLLLIIVLVIFVCEVLIMFVLGRLPSLAPYQKMFLDAILLSTVTFPSLYFLVFRPLNLHISRRRQAEQQKDKLIEQLKNAIDEVKTLQGIIPICSSCKSIRDDKGYWQKVESYIQNHSDAVFSHGLCNDCIRKNYPDQAERIIKRLDLGDED